MRHVMVVLCLVVLGCDGSDGNAPSAGSGGVGGASGSGGSSGEGGASGEGGSAGSAGSAGASGSGGDGGNAGTGTGGAGGLGGSGGAGGNEDMWWRPAPGTSWQWQLSGNLDTSFDVAVYDIDMEESSEATIDALHAEGRKVICYFDTAYEPYRSDSAQLEAYRGNPIDGWPGQYWLDIREGAVVEVMRARIDRAAMKGCDAVEADDVDSRSNDPGFPITQNDQVDFIRALAEVAHQAGMAFGLKNALDDIEYVLDVADFAINEECFEYDECDALAPFIDAGKAVFHVEYTDGNLANRGADICPQANALNFDSLIKHWDLDAPRFSCR